jgi:hypothetical protein
LGSFNLLIWIKRLPLSFESLIYPLKPEMKQGMANISVDSSLLMIADLSNSQGHYEMFGYEKNAGVGAFSKKHTGVRFSGHSLIPAYRKIFNAPSPLHKRSTFIVYRSGINYNMPNSLPRSLNCFGNSGWKLRNTGTGYEAPTFFPAS